MAIILIVLLVIAGVLVGCTLLAENSKQNGPTASTY